ncbi:5'-nucleotidase C-terminal domain-containing protein [Neobacillus sp. 19]|uniref:5'-nucleotidase C-terminal domain-containing protein n=1 Tax=Neobacillus sp. 19 TaxID=3394458 RepID=UPI003BF69D44
MTKLSGGWKFPHLNLNKIDPNKEGNQELLDYDFRPYNYDVIDGVKYQIDVTKPVGQRIIKLTMMDGTAVQPTQKFIVATNNYRAGGSGGLAELKDAKVVVDSPFENRQILMDYITEKGTINPVADNNWKIAPVGGVAKLVFHSAPEAKPYLGQTPNVKDLGASTTKPGYELFELDQKVHVQLLGINDYHGQLDTWKTYKDSKGNVTSVVGGIEYLAGYMKDREAANPANTLMIQAGDLVGASPPVSALLQDEPTIRFMNEIGIDVGTIGNHEFDEGVTEMKRLINGGSHPKTEKYEAKYGKFTGSTMEYVVANAVDEKTNEPILKPYVIKEVDGIKFGFIGVVTTETPKIVTPSGVAGVKFTDEIEAINKYAKVLKDQGVKNIVVLAHNPGTSDKDGKNPTGQVVDIAKKVDSEIDVIYGAHDHKYLNSTVDGKLLVQSLSYGQAFSDIDLTVDPITGDIIKSETKAEIVDTDHAKITPDAKVKAALDGYQADIAPIVNQKVSETAVELSKTANEHGESVLGNVIADGMRSITGTELAFMNSGGIRNPLPKGTITWGDLFKVQPFGNDLVTMKITGDQVRTLLNQQFQEPESYNKIMAISGLKYTWTNSNPKGSKVLDIYLEDGSLIDPKAEYTITVNNFMADGGDGFTILKSGKNRVTGPVDLDAFVDYFKTLPTPFSAEIEGRILIDTFVDQPEVSVTNFDKYLYGYTEPMAKVKASVGDKEIGTVTADEDGYFEIKLKDRLATGTVIRLTITDRTGNLAPFDITVEAATGWVWDQDEKGNDIWYYINPETGEMTANKWFQEDGVWYHFNKNGIMETGWVLVNGKWYFLSKDEDTLGEMQTGWFQENGKKYYLDQVNGDMKVNWYNVNGKWYYFNKSGAMQTGWYLENGKWYFLDKANGDMKVNWVNVNGKWYFFNKSGAMLTGWVKDGNTWYYLTNSGAMQTGWVKVNNKWYFLKSSGAMQTGWVQVGSKWYFLYNDGSMAANTSIGKYKLGKDGAWIN